MSAPRKRRWSGVLVLAALVAAGLTAPVQAAETPTLTPIPADLGKGIQGRVSPTAQDLPALGYTEEEFKVEGTATSYTADGNLGSDGKWNVKPASQAPYTTRVVVRRPTNPAKFNGTVVVEWVNVSFGVDIPVEFGQSWEEFVREGYAYVGVSAQKVGIDKLKSYDPVRYPDVTTPGDAASYDIFSQAAKAAGQQLNAKRMIASGHSQSALRLVTYANAIQPRDRIFDGFLIHGRSTGAAEIASGQSTPLISNIRDDLGVPTLQVQAETDTLVYSISRQPDATNLRTWEVAGTAHGDAYLTESLDKVNAREKIIDNGNPVRCDKPLNAMPAHYAHNAAYHALDQWIRTGKPAPRAPRIEGLGPLLSRDGNQNVKGGIRLPDIEAPIASYGPTNSGGNVPGACLLLGTTTAFDAAKLRSLYPTHAAYVTRYTAAAAKARDAGFLRPADYTAAVRAAQARPVPPA
ncbi:alpha/beta hydrolase domain-containing protein [Cryptosporangium minutisporangium]|uniref:Alpha/beta hydrolase domain-containing protein n=1 Tax=Cryptosporangium minutisporangium TaxID=113569 RepID=A0ABP6SXW0_9ACTN